VIRPCRFIWNVAVLFPSRQNPPRRRLQDYCDACCSACIPSKPRRLQSQTCFSAGLLLWAILLRVRLRDRRDDEEQGWRPHDPQLCVPPITASPSEGHLPLQARQSEGSTSPSSPQPTQRVREPCGALPQVRSMSLISCRQRYALCCAGCMLLL
jgi:hypothetical protein